MASSSDLLMQLRPVTFHYKKEVAPDSSDERQYGLIAEEVAEVAPELVAPDLEGRPYSVKYHVLPVLLLNEAQKQRRENEEQRSVIAEQRQVIAEQRQTDESQALLIAEQRQLDELQAHTIAAQRAQIGELSARIESLERRLSRPEGEAR